MKVTWCIQDCKNKIVGISFHPQMFAATQEMYRKCINFFSDFMVTWICPFFRAVFPLINLNLVYVNLEKKSFEVSRKNPFEILIIVHCCIELLIWEFQAYFYTSSKVRIIALAGGNNGCLILISVWFITSFMCQKRGMHPFHFYHTVTKYSYLLNYFEIEKKKFSFCQKKYWIFMELLKSSKMRLLEENRFCHSVWFHSGAKNHRVCLLLVWYA